MGKSLTEQNWPTVAKKHPLRGHERKTFRGTRLRREPNLILVIKYDELAPELLELYHFCSYATKALLVPSTLYI